jgi:hypothetical protein
MSSSEGKSGLENFWSTSVTKPKKLPEGRKVIPLFEPAVLMDNVRAEKLARLREERRKRTSDRPPTSSTSQTLEAQARNIEDERREKQEKFKLEEIQSSTKHAILHPPLKDALKKIDNPRLKQLVDLLIHSAVDEPLFNTQYEAIRKTGALWLKLLAELLHKKSVTIITCVAGRPDIARKGEDSDWIIGCTVEALQLPHPKVTIVKKERTALDKRPREIDLFDVFSSLKGR